MHGGLGMICVTDNGEGMSPDDLAICWHSHATSKISTERDLDAVRTMGFRGEALSSIAAVARLEVETALGTEGSRLVVEAGKQQVLEPHPRGGGTLIRVSRLFHQLPGRRNFLRSDRAEGAAVRRELLNRAQGFPEVEFSLTSLQPQSLPDGPGSGTATAANGRPALLLPATTDLRERFAAILGPSVDVRLLEELRGDFGDFSVRVVVGEPGLFRRDRGGIRVCVNRRPVTDFRFVQAIEYGYTGLMPNGRHPLALVLLEAEPGLVDANVHPAKREVKLRRGKEMHHAVVELVQAWAAKRLGSSGTVGRWSPDSLDAPQASRQWGLSFPARSTGEPGPLPLPQGSGRWPARATDVETAATMAVAESAPPADQRTADASPSRLRYRGPLFDEFLLAEDESALYVVDFHAAHERQLYRAFRSASPSQHLLVSLPFSVDPAVDLRLQERERELASAGIGVRRRAPGEWDLIGVPVEFSGNAETLLAELERLPGGTLPIAQALFANRACRAALKAGDMPDDASAQALLDSLAGVPDPRCPHGRPVFLRITRAELRAGVARE